MTECNLHNEQSERLKDLLDFTAFEVLPSVKAVGLLNKIPEEKTVNVTCRPTGIEDTMAFIQAVEEKERERLCPHIAARRIVDKRHFYEICQILVEKEIKQVFVIGGDGEPVGEYKSAMDVLLGFSEAGVHFDQIGVGGYPEENAVFDMDETEVLQMKQYWAEQNKTEMFVVTQVCFEPETVLGWIEDIRMAGVMLPVRVGVLGKIGFESFSKVLGSLGIYDIVSFLKSKTDLARSMATHSLGGYSPVGFVSELAEKSRDYHGLYGVNVFTLGNISASVEALKSLEK